MTQHSIEQTVISGHSFHVRTCQEEHLYFAHGSAWHYFVRRSFKLTHKNYLNGYYDQIDSCILRTCYKTIVFINPTELQCNIIMIVFNFIAIAQVFTQSIQARFVFLMKIKKSCELWEQLLERKQTYNENFHAGILIYVEVLIQANIACDLLRNFQL